MGLAVDQRTAIIAAMSRNAPRTLARLAGVLIPDCRLHLPHRWNECGAEWHPRTGWFARRAYWCPRCRTAFEVTDTGVTRTWTVSEEDAPRA